MDGESKARTATAHEWHTPRSKTTGLCTSLTAWRHASKGLRGSRTQDHDRADRGRPRRGSELVRAIGPASRRFGLSLARLAQRATPDVWVRAIRGDHIAGPDAGKRGG